MSKKRSKARAFALQAVYQWQMSDNQINDIINQFLLENDSKSFESKYFQDLLRGVVTNLDDLDALLQPLIDRQIEQVDPVERAVLRLGAYELKFHPEIPYRVVINEAVELAKTYGAEKGHKYVNGVIDKLAQSLRSIEVNARRQTSN
ncbi:MAG: transcription antitermination factor NusB [Chromatiales bacterium]|jgi:N utilization substance protein B